MFGKVQRDLNQAAQEGSQLGFEGITKCESYPGPGILPRD